MQIDPTAILALISTLTSQIAVLTKENQELKLQLNVETTTGD